MRPNAQSMPVASRGQDGRNRETIAYSPSPEKVATIVTQPKRNQSLQYQLSIRVAAVERAGSNAVVAEAGERKIFVSRGEPTRSTVGFDIAAYLGAIGRPLAFPRAPRRDPKDDGNPETRI